MPQLAPQTRRLYECDWAAFRNFCRRHGHVALPAGAATLEAYVAALSGRVGRGCLDRHVAAIAHAHWVHGAAMPIAADLRARLRPHKRAARPDARRRSPDAAELTGLAAACPGDLAGLRDRALLLLAAEGLGRVALTGLDVEHVLPDPDGQIRLARLDPGAARRAATAGRLSGAAAAALADWLRASDTRFGPVFRKIDRWGNVEHRRLGCDAVRRILLRRTPQRGYFR